MATPNPYLSTNQRLHLIEEALAGPLGSIERRDLQEKRAKLIEELQVERDLDAMELRAGTQ